VHPPRASPPTSGRHWPTCGASCCKTRQGSTKAGSPATRATRKTAAAIPEALAESLQLPIGCAVDFWTEASLFSQAGLNAIVYGPGDIAQAHAADEWVALDQLQRYADSIHRIVSMSAQ
jgi:N-acetylcitrulline deacetylase (EC 3.5.1.-)